MNVTALLCSLNGSCAERRWKLPASHWSSTCDTLGDAVHRLDGGIEVARLYAWVASGAAGTTTTTTSDTGARVQLTLYSAVYCGGLPIGWQGASGGVFPPPRARPRAGARRWEGSCDR